MAGKKYVMDRNVIHSGVVINKGQLCPEALIPELSKKGYAHPIPEPAAAPAPAPHVPQGVQVSPAPTEVIKPGNAQ